MTIGVRGSLLAAAAAVLVSSSGATAAGKLDTLYSFCSQSGCPDGDQPYGGVTLLAPGHMIGTTGFGGKYNGGTVFALDDKHGTAKLRTLASICAGTPPSCASDEGPSSTLVEDTSGNIYGTVYFGGSSGDGAVFELEAKAKQKYKLHYLYNFNGTDGFGPQNLTYAGQLSGARYDGASPLYGAAIAGGTEGSGIVFSITPKKGKWTLATLYNFCSASNCTDGGLPEAAPIVDPSGVLYGTTEYDGAGNAGTIYELANTNGSWNYSLLYTFCPTGNCTDGDGSYAGLAEDASGNLYGTTYFGGSENDGVAFEYAPGSGTYTVLHDFCSQTNCTDGSEPFAGVTLDASGNIFGTTSRGGDRNYGTVFEIAKGKFRVAYSFCALTSCADGGYPYGTLAIDSKGLVYGTTQYGGANDLGQVYELKP